MAPKQQTAVLLFTLLVGLALLLTAHPEEPDQPAPFIQSLSSGRSLKQQVRLPK